MSKNWKKLIVISAINIREGGPLTILNNCLAELAQSEVINYYEIVALVHKKELCVQKGITYIEFKNTNKRVNYFFNEYYGIKKQINENDIALLISLTDKTPSITAYKKAVYIHNPTPFFKIKIKDFVNRPFLVLYKYFYVKLCTINIKTNNNIIVQQDWLRTAYSKLLNFPQKNIIVFPPVMSQSTFAGTLKAEKINKCQSFIFPSLPRSFKNFEIICEAVKIVNATIKNDFEVMLTLNGTENKYSNFIYNKYRNIRNIKFLGVVAHEKLLEIYQESDCLVFSSRLETWGLAISEFSALNKPMLLADLPYARNTAQGSKQVSFFDVNNADEIARKMILLIRGDTSFLQEVPIVNINPPYTTSWVQTVNYILDKYEQ
jgi:glycosyltransferase involved in cell wall biosynthesis